MICPKCKGNWAYIQQFIVPERPIVTGVTCILCGYWRDIELPEMPVSDDFKRYATQQDYQNCAVPGCDGVIDANRNKTGICNICRSRISTWIKSPFNKSAPEIAFHINPSPLMEAVQAKLARLQMPEGF